VIKNVIFDLGGVLYRLDLARTEDSFKRLQVNPDGDAELEYHFEEGSATIFDRFELGQVSEAEFREELRSRLTIEAGDDDIDEAWNALLVSPVEENLELLLRIRGNARIFLLSNTNSIHVRHVGRACPALFPIFEKVYFSHELGLRKPGREIYEYLLKDAGMKASETLFLDDSVRNVDGARAAGLHALLIEKAEDLGQQPLLQEIQGEK